MFYLLSILDGVNGTLVGLTVLFLLGAAVTFGFWLDAESDTRSGDAKTRESAAESMKELKPWRNGMLAAGLFAAALNIATPDTDSIMKAYVMVEGRKVMTAENAEAATKALLERADKLIEAVGKR